MAREWNIKKFTASPATIGKTPASMLRMRRQCPVPFTSYVNLLTLFMLIPAPAFCDCVFKWCSSIDWLFHSLTFFVFFKIMVKLSMRSPLLRNFEVCNTGLLTTGSTLYSRSLEFIHCAENEVLGFTVDDVWASCLMYMSQSCTHMVMFAYSFKHTPSAC